MLSVQTNLAANTALKNINTNSVNMNKSLERLSSGFRINNAADDAAGFAVSSKLDAQTSRLKAASLNASQAQAMVKMADAGVNEIQNMVNRIQTLAIQASSANNAGELGKLNSERIKLEGAIDKIANSTNFNGVNLLSGTSAKGIAAVVGTASNAATVTTAASGVASGATVSTAGIYESAGFTITTVAAVNQADGAIGGTTAAGSVTALAVNAATTVASAADAAAINGQYFMDVTTTGTAGNTLKIYKGADATGTLLNTITLAANTNQTNVSIGANGLSLDINVGTLANNAGVNFTMTGAQAAAGPQVTSVTSSAALLDANGTAVAGGAVGSNLLTGGTAVARANGANTVLNLIGTGKSITIADVATGSQTAGSTLAITTTAAVAGIAQVLAGGALNANYTFQVGADNTASNQVDLNLQNNYTASGLGLGLAGNDLLTQANAKAYVDLAKTALDTVVTNRAELGATQNQVAFIQANLSTSIEQTTASVSSIRDADMAAEMANFTKNKILTQASTSMLAQANQVSQNVLSLFR